MKPKKGTPAAPAEHLIERLEIPNSPVLIIKKEKEFFPVLGAHRLSDNTFSSYKSAVEYCKTDNINYMIQLIAAITHYTYITMNNIKNEDQI